MGQCCDSQSRDLDKDHMVEVPRAGSSAVPLPKVEAASTSVTRDAFAESQPAAAVSPPKVESTPEPKPKDESPKPATGGVPLPATPVAPPAASSIEMAVTVQRDGQQPMGLVLDTKTFFPKFVMVKRVNSGIVLKHNSAQGDSSRQLLVGDMVSHVEVNGVKKNCLESKGTIKDSLAEGGTVTFYFRRNSWHVVVERTEGAKLGLVMKRHGDYSQVTTVRDVGMIADFNRANPSKAIQADDAVLSINAKPLYESIVEQAKIASRLDIEVLRPASARSFDIVP